MGNLFFGLAPTQTVQMSPQAGLDLKMSRQPPLQVRALVGNEQCAGLSWSPAPVNAGICAGSGQDYFLQSASQILIFTLATDQFRQRH